MPPHAEPGADQPDLPPVYTGPTPANPFGGHTFDIFDVMDQAEAAVPVAGPVAVAAVPEPEPVASIILADPEPVAKPTGRCKSRRTREPEPVPAARSVEPEPVQVEAPFSEPETECVAPEPELEPVGAANDVAAEPAIKPIIIGGEQEVVLEKKRGWWRR